MCISDTFHDTSLGYVLDNLSMVLYYYHMSKVTLKALSPIIFIIIQLFFS